MSPFLPCFWFNLLSPPLPIRPLFPPSVLPTTFCLLRPFFPYLIPHCHTSFFACPLSSLVSGSTSFHRLFPFPLSFRRPFSPFYPASSVRSSHISFHIAIHFSLHVPFPSFFRPILPSPPIPHSPSLSAVRSPLFILPPPSVLPNISLFSVRSSQPILPPPSVLPQHFSLQRTFFPAHPTSSVRSSLPIKASASVVHFSNGDNGRSVF